jgi:MOSC domain-containing protein YiiM
VSVTARLASLNIARDDQVLTGIWTGRKKRSGIGKRPVTDRLSTGAHRLDGDNICDRHNHGGPDQAAYAYAVEDIEWWSDQLGRSLGPGALGENLTTAGVDVTGAIIGERWAVGTAVLEVSVPRIPCRVFQEFWQVPNLIKWFTSVGRPGAYLRIWTPGELGAGDSISVVHRPEHGVTISETFRALTGDRSLAHRLLQAPQLPAQAHESARTWLSSI